MIIRWLNEAVNDLQFLRDYIAQDSGVSAVKVVRRILRSVDLLLGQPGIGRPGRVANTRELIVSGTPYIIPYRVRGDVIEILRVFHCAMQWPEKV